MLNDTAYNFYNMVILEELEPMLIGTQIVAKAQNLPPGIQLVTRDELKKLRGKARRGHPDDPVPHEVGRTQRKATYVVEHIHGFDIPDQDMLATQQPSVSQVIKLPTAAARQSARLVAESIEDTIFNGIPNLPVPGLGVYANAGANSGSGYPVTGGDEWDTANGNPFKDIVNAVEMLEETSRYHARWAVLPAKAIRNFSNTTSLGISYAQMIRDASDKNFFPNGMDDFYPCPMPALKYSNDAETILKPPIVGTGKEGVIGDYGNRVAERYVQNIASGIAVNDGLDEAPQGDIALVDYPKNRDNLWPFNIQTYQGVDMHYIDAFCKITNTLSVSGF